MRDDAGSRTFFLVSTCPSILLVDDDRELCALLATYLSNEGFVLEARHDYASGLERARNGAHTLVVLDVMLEGQSGLDLLRELRSFSDLPALMLTARASDIDRIVGLEMGADDYLAKPFNPRELLARIRAILRRPTATRRSPIVSQGELTIDAAARSITVGDVEIEVTTIEFALLDVLVRQAGSVVSRETLSRAVLGRPFSPFDRSLDVHVSNLRKKLADHSPRLRIKTVRNHGYLYAVERA